MLQSALQVETPTLEIPRADFAHASTVDVNALVVSASAPFFICFNKKNKLYIYSKHLHLLSN